ncbi:MAG: CapA family protein [Dehalococcoidia bacterium]
MTAQDGKVTMIAVGDIGPIWEPVEPLVELALPVLQQGDLRYGMCERIYSEEGSNDKREWVGPDVLHPRMANIYPAGGFNVVSLASNHSMGYREMGVIHNIETFRNLGITAFGTGKNLAEARKPAIVEKNGVKIAFLGYNSVLVGPRDGATASKPGPTPLRIRTWYEPVDTQPGTPPRVMTMAFEEDMEAMVDDVRKAKQQADVVIMCIHWGIHFIPKVLAMYQPVVGHAAIDAGVDLILGCHAHKPAAIEVYKGKVCFYSLSNFIMQNAGLGVGFKGEAPKPSALDPTPLRRDRYGVLEEWGVPRDPDYPHLPYGIAAPKTLMAKLIISKQGVERASFIPTLIGTDLRPEPLKAGDPRFDELLKYWKWVSDEFPTRFRVEGDEVVIEAAG